MGKPLRHALPTPSSVVSLIEDEVARGEGKLSTLGRKLLDARRRIEQSGVRLLDEKQIEKEKAERRLGVENSKA